MNEMFLKGNNELINTKPQYNDLVERFLNYLDVAESTIQTYKYSLKQWAIYMRDNNIINPTRDDVLNYKSYLLANNSANTTNLYLASLKNFYKWLEYEEITKDITKNIKSINVGNKHLRRSLTIEEVKRLLNSCENTRERLLITLSTTCALRSNEVTNIRLEDFYKIDGVTMLKVLGKGRNGLKIDSVKIDDRVLELIKEYCKEYDITDYLFTSTSNHNTGEKVNNITIRRIFNKLCEKAEIDRDRLTFHSCRHFSATQTFKSGMDLQEVSENLRHRSITTSAIYLDEIKQHESKFSTILGDIVFDK